MIDGYFLKKKATEIRKKILLMTSSAGSGHIAGPLGIADVFSYLYFHKFPLESNNNILDLPFILSCAHYAPVLYATLIESGLINEELTKLRQFGSILQGHTMRNTKYGIYNTGGSLGQGIGLACGMAFANRNKNVYCLISDGETNEGSVWEAALFATKYKLNNLYLILDRNGIQQSGTSNEQMPLQDLEEKWSAFGFEVNKANGNDLQNIDLSFQDFSKENEKPKILITFTIPGFGYKAIENNYKWHGKVLSKEQCAEAIIELDNNLSNYVQI